VSLRSVSCQPTLCGAAPLLLRRELPACLSVRLLAMPRVDATMAHVLLFLAVAARGGKQSSFNMTKADDCPSCPNLDFWCGKDWRDANTRCHTPCPRCKGQWCDTCANGEKCFASCMNCAPPVPAPPPTPAVCGGHKCPGKDAYCCGQIDDSALCVDPAANQTCCRTAAASDEPRVCGGGQICCAGQSFGSGATCCGKNQTCAFHVGAMPTCNSAVEG
jgi:hypothetical protein